MADGDALWRIEAPYFVAGFVVVHGRVSLAAPILNYMLGWRLDRALHYVETKHWRIGACRAIPRSRCGRSRTRTT